MTQGGSKTNRVLCPYGNIRHLPRDKWGSRTSEGATGEVRLTPKEVLHRCSKSWHWFYRHIVTHIHTHIVTHVVTHIHTQRCHQEQLLKSCCIYDLIKSTLETILVSNLT